ncbi:MAG: C25 family cysteine peptidase [Planctomycetota bacterium]
MLIAALSCVLQASATPPVDLVVVAPRAFVPALTPYLEHRRGRLGCELLVLEDALAAHEGVDEAERLKRALYERWRAGRRYVLLVGDADRLPVRYMMLDRVTPAACDVAFYGSDLYYGDLARPDGSFDDWNARKDGEHGAYFGEVHGERHKDGPINFDGIDYLPEVGVGRWPVSSVAELEALVAKSLAHENESRVAVPSSMALLVVPGWVDASPAFDDVVRACPGWRTLRRGFGDGSGGVDGEAVATLLCGGVDLLVHAGHGSPNGFDGSLCLTDLPRLRDRRRLPIVLSAGCSTAYFATLPPYEDYVDVRGVRHAGTDRGERFTAPPPAPACLQPADLDRGGFGERMLLGPGGAIAYFGCDTGAQPCALTLVGEFAKSIARGNGRLGDAWRTAVTRYFERERLAELEPTESWYPPSVFFQAMKFVLFGDPSLPLPESASVGEDRPQAEPAQTEPAQTEPAKTETPVRARRRGGPGSRPRSRRPRSRTSTRRSSPASAACPSACRTSPVVRRPSRRRAC